MNQFTSDLFCFVKIFQKTQLGFIFRIGGSVSYNVELKLSFFLIFVAWK